MTTTLTCNIDGARIDTYLADNMPALTRSAAARLLTSKQVIIIPAGNSGTHQEIFAKKNHKTLRGEKYIITQDEPVNPTALRQDIRLDVVFEDDDVIVINKPRGMVVHPAPGHADGTLVNALLYHCGNSLSGIGGELRPGIVHRIDKDTSGLLIVAKNDNAHVSLSKQLSARTLSRCYDAIACGRVKNDSGTINAPLGRHPNDRKKQAVFEQSRCGFKTREAITHYTIVTRFEKYTHIQCRLETGRTHQIRVHMAHIGHPILGDRVYGRKKPELGMESQCLHARSLRFIHPSTSKLIELTSELPGYFIDVLNKLKAEIIYE